MPQGLSAHRPTAYQARPGGRPVSRQTGPSAQKNIPASLLEGPSAAGSAAHPRAEAADGSRMVPWFRCNRCTPSPRRLHPVGALVAPRSRLGVHLLHPDGAVIHSFADGGSGTGARFSAQEIASTLTRRRSSAVLPWSGPPRLLSQFLSHSPPSGTVHQCSLG